MKLNFMHGWIDFAANDGCGSGGGGSFNNTNSLFTRNRIVCHLSEWVSECVCCGIARIDTKNESFELVKASIKWVKITAENNEEEILS